MDTSQYNPVSDDQISALEANRCRAEDWSRVRVSNAFNPAQVLDSEFRGEVLMGKARILRAILDNVCVEDDAVIENVGTLACSGETTFGNGEELEVLNEGGGRELKMTSITSSQIAYLSVLYRDKGDAYVTRSFDFGSLGSFSSSLALQSAAGGGDTPEAMDSALAESSLSFTGQMRERERGLLNKIEKTLEAIERGTYGECESCGEPIAPKRLLARPVASLCIDCKGEQERFERQDA